MLEWIVIAFACVGMHRIASADGKSGTFWAMLTFLLCFTAALTVPAPFLRVFGAAFLSFALMLLSNLVKKD